MQPAFDQPVVIKELVRPCQPLQILLKATPGTKLTWLGELDHTARCGIKEDIVLGSVSVLKVGCAIGEDFDFKLWKCFKAAREGFGLVGCGP